MRSDVASYRPSSLPASALADEVPLLARPGVWRSAIVVILLAAAFFRFDNITQPFSDAFSWRQASTAMMAWNFHVHSPNIFMPAVNWNGPEPAYTGREFQTVTALAALLYKILGPQEWIGRAIAATFGVWGVFAFYLLVRRVWDEPRALASALMLALMPGAAFIDRSFLPGPAMLALTITTVWQYVVFLQTGRRRHLVLAAVVGCIAFLTQLPGVTSVVPMAYATVVMLGAKGRLDRAHVVPILKALAVPLLPIAAYFSWAVYVGMNYPPYHIAGGGNWVWSKTGPSWLENNYFLDGIASQFYHWMWAWPILLLALIGVAVSPRRDDAPAGPSGSPPATAPWFFHVWLAAAMLLIVIGARELHVNPWNLHIFNPAGAAFAGQGLCFLAAGRRPWAAAAGLASIGRRARLAAPLLRATAIVLVVFVVSRGAMATLYGPQADASYRLGKALHAVSAEGDTVVTIADDVGDPVAIYYSRRRGWVFPPAHRLEVWRDWNLMPSDDAIAIELFEGLRNAGANWLGIVTNPRDDTPDSINVWADHPRLIEHFDRTCEFVRKTESFVIYRIRTPDELAEIERWHASTRPAIPPATQPAAAH